MSDLLFDLLSATERPRALVVGDLMLDRLIWGRTEQPRADEAFPVLRITREEYRVGGAGGAAIRLAARGFRVRLVSITGGDDRDRLVRQLLAEAGVGAQWVFPDPERVTTVREHFMGPVEGKLAEPMLRVDRWDGVPIGQRLANELLHAVWDQLDLLDVILVCDYGHGVCSGEFVPQLKAIAAAAGVEVIDGRAVEARGPSESEHSHPCSHAQSV